MIICIVLAQEKRNHSLKWSQAKECYDGTCSVLGHFDDDDLEDIRDTALECVKEDTDIEDDDFDDQVEDAMLEIAAEHDLRWDVCDGREMLWDELTHMSNPDKICHTLAKQGFTKYDEVSFLRLWTGLGHLYRDTPSFVPLIIV